MLDAETKRKIDGLRDTLVGKIPVPTEQVKQITLGLIYKFMSDIDAENEELGSKSFFNSEYQRYSWRYIMDRSLSSYDRVLLYSEGLEKMTLNPNIPQLFRDIFKGAFLPFRDPMVVDQFLKGINEFKYEHSEDLGTAFESLLSVMGAQGEAGQFRTPRHIIDFIVRAVDPQKTDRILDPACGTAGFLISAYKHILEQNIDPKQNKPGSALTTVERTNLSKNFVGYDISHDMVRISLVNMYLHQFSEPKIYEYDTLCSLDRWDDNFDCILANPPFMTPKGGIQPHNRFSIRANRSEVLFVDYIAEHLNPSGKAGIIVPEGIIFASANAYKTLRKMLVDTGYLWAVVSLPAGVFNPYAGVKTSILLIDKVLAKRSKDILFLKVENDGYDLGAQRREIQENDLPKVLEVINSYKQAVIVGKDCSEVIRERHFANLVTKARIAESRDFSLSIERYKEVVTCANHKWPLVELGEVCELKYGKPLKEENRIPGDYPVFGSNGVVGHHNEFLVESPFIVVGRKGSAGSVTYSYKNGFPIDTTFYIKLENENKILLKFLYFVLTGLDLGNVNVQAGVPGLNRADAYKIKIPLPPLEVQQQIVAELNGFQKIINGAKQVIVNYKPTIKIDPAWEMVVLGDVCEILDNMRKPVTKADRKPGPYPYYGATGIVDYVAEFIFDEKLVLIGEDGAKWDKGDQTAFLAAGKYWVNNHAHVLRPDRSKILDELIVHLFNQMDLSGYITGVTVPKLNQEKLRAIKIPLPPLEIQKQIIGRIEEEQNLVEMNRKLVEIFEHKIKERIGEVWGKE